MSDAQRELQPLLPSDQIEATPVYPIIHMIKSDIVHFIDTPLTHEALTAPDLTYTLVRPLEEKYNAIQRQGNMSVVFCFLINRVHFLRDQSLTNSQLSRSRAALCEILAIRTLNVHAHSADPEVIAQAREENDELEDRVGNAIEIAIICKAKRFIKSSACQRVINAIWSGKCVYQAQSSHSILSDTYKRTPIHFYDPHKAPLLDHYRLKVPAIRMVLEYLDFLALFVLFVFALEMNERDRLNLAEGMFLIYGLGFALEKVAAMQEHGMKVWFTGTWNGFDLAFVTIYYTYAFMRVYGIYHDDLWARSMGIDILALIACLMFPRLAFVTLRNNLMVLSLRAMIVQFVILMMIATFCFGGFFYALWTLSRNAAGYTAGQIAWWMLDLWFGLDATGFDKASEFHPIFGPLMMVTYACLSNTLLLTVLVSILSHTFSTITEDAQAEAMFRKAVTTIEGVKADPLFSYLPPINLVALAIMWPLSYVLTPRWFHKVNVFMIRITSFPILLIIAWYERQSKNIGALSFYDTVTAAAEKIIDTLPRQMKRLTFFDGLAGKDSSIDAIFELEDENDNSALDMREYDDPHTMGILNHRRLSEQSHRRASVGGHRPTSPQRAANTPAVPAARQRVNSLMNRSAEAAHNFTSPLAQIFQPLVVDEDIPEEPSDQPSPPMVSFGPATRRRLSSMHRKSSTEPNANTTQQTSPRKFPQAPDSRGHGSLNSQPLSESPGQNSREGETASELQDEGSTGDSAYGQLSKRFDKLEERHQRIEDMLLQLTRHLRTR